MPNSLSYNGKMNYKVPIILMLLVSSLACPKPVIASTDVLRIAISSVPNSLDPLFATDANSQNINRLQYLSLVDTDRGMNIRCRACTSYEIKKTQAGEVIYFSLRKDLNFQDGEKIKAQDVYDSWIYYTDPQNKSVFRSAFEKIKRLEVLNDYDLKIYYDESQSENISNLVLLKIMKRKDERIIESGPYSLEDQSPMSIKLRANRAHFEVAETNPTAISFHVVRDETTLALRLLKEEVDLSVANISPRKENWLMSRENSPLKVLKATGTNTVYIGVNHNSKYLSSFNVRKAISHLIPRELLNKYKLRNSVELSTGLFSRVFDGLYIENKIDQYEPELAKALLEKDGYTLEDGLWKKDNQPIIIDWKATNNRASLEIVEIIRSYLLKNGIQVKLTIQEWGTFSRSVRNGNFDLIMGQWVGLAGPEMLGFVFHSDRIPPKGANRGKFENADFDRVYDEGLEANDEKKSMSLFKMAHEVAIKNYAYIQLWHPEIRWISRSCLESSDLYSSGSFLSLLGITKKCKD
jgi:peptide/nickel transport system substrate-binding protein